MTMVNKLTSLEAKLVRKYNRPTNQVQIGGTMCSAIFFFWPNFGDQLLDDEQKITKLNKAS